MNDQSNTNQTERTGKSDFTRTLSCGQTSILNKQQKLIIKCIRKLSRGIDYVVLLLSLCILFIGAYTAWDTQQVEQVASPEEYEMYKPTPLDNLSFEKLVKLNPEIIGWLDIYDTKIDYPIAQSDDNIKYLNTTVLGKFSTGGAVFLDCRNTKDFSDNSNIVYGHYMADRKMFGDISLFDDAEFFATHKYAVLHRNNLPDKGITFIAFVETLGNDKILLSPVKNDLKEKEQLISYIYKKAKFSRKTDAEIESLIVLDTCNLDITDGRRVLVGVLTDKVEENTFKIEKSATHNLFQKLVNQPFYKTHFLLLLVIIWLILIVFYIILKIIHHIRTKSQYIPAN